SLRVMFFIVLLYTRFFHLCNHSSFPTRRSSDLKQMLRDFIGIRVNRAKKSGMVNITSSVNSRERSGINTTGYIDHAAILGTINQIGRAVQQECRDRARIPSSSCKKKYDMIS